MATQFLDTKFVNERLLQLSMKTGFNCVQKNGQRFYGPPPYWVGPPPPRGSEIFIGKLPRDCFEDEIVPVLESVAPIYEFRLMMNFTGFNRGFAFATYTNPRDAWKAVELLNNYEIKPGHTLGISKSIDNCRLYVGGIPTDKNKADAWEEVMKVCPGAEDIIFYSNPVDRRKNRGFFFIEFSSHRAAAMARRLCLSGIVRMWNVEVHVDWADPEPDVNPYIMDNITILFVRNIRPKFTREKIYQILAETVPFSALIHIYLSDHYAFIHFDSRYHAQQAKDILSFVVVEGELLDVQWARPKCFRKVSGSLRFRWLPPRMRSEKYKPKLQTQSRPSSPPLLPSLMPPLLLPNDPTPKSAPQKNVKMDTNLNMLHYCPYNFNPQYYFQNFSN